MLIAEKNNGSVLLFDKKHQLFFNFLDHTDQATNAIHYMNKMINEFTRNIPDSETVKYLDVGCGYGDKTEAVIESVKKMRPIYTTALDPSNELLSIFKSQSMHEHIEFISSIWESYQVLKSFHLITAIHTFYYISDWKNAINKMINALAKNGVICIAIRSNDQVCQFKNYFFEKLDGVNKKEPDFEALCQTLNALGIHYESKIIESRLNINDCLSMNEKGKQLVEFLLRKPYIDLPDNIHYEIVDYLKQHQRDGCLLHQDGFVWITDSSKCFKSKDFAEF